MKNKIGSKILILMMALSLLLGSCIMVSAAQAQDVAPQKVSQSHVVKGGEYTSTQQVAEYIHIYGELPSNFITKNEARKLGWNPKKGNLWEVTDHKSIGGDIFTNRQKVLPHVKGRIWHECDVNYQGGYRQTDRLVYSNDGLIYFTNDHYRTFTQLY